MPKAVDLIKILSGHPFRGSIREKRDGEVCVVQMKDVEEDGAVGWTEAIRTNLTGKKQPDYLKAGDVLLVARGRKNYAVCLEEVPGSAVCSPHFFLLRVKQGTGLLPGFLAWQLNQAPAQRYFDKSAEGSLQRSLRKAVVEDLPLTVPSLDLQEKVMALATLARREADALRQLIENREQMLRYIASDVLGN